LRVGNGGNGGDPDTVYFTAGISDEQHGLFGSIASSVPDSSSTLALLAIGAGAVLSMRRARATL